MIVRGRSCNGPARSAETAARAETRSLTTAKSSVADLPPSPRASSDASHEPHASSLGNRRRDPACWDRVDAAAGKRPAGFRSRWRRRSRQSPSPSAALRQGRSAGASDAAYREGRAVLAEDRAPPARAPHSDRLARARWRAARVPGRPAGRGRPGRPGALRLAWTPGRRAELLQALAARELPGHAPAVHDPILRGFELS
jgi:hypothetical protein